MEYPKVSVCILNHGLERIQKCLPSILVQDYPNKEIIVFDNQSTAKSSSWLSSFLEIDIICSDINLEYGRAKNILVNKAKGQYVLLIDNDIELITKNILIVLLDHYETIKNIAFLTTLIKDVNSDYIENLGLFYNRIQKKKRLSAVYGRGVFPTGSFNGNIVFFERQLFLDLGGFDEIYPFNIDDYDMGARAYLKGYTNYITTNAYVIHHGVETRSDIESLCWKEKYYFSGFSRMIFKNYRIVNIVFLWPMSTLWLFYKNMKLCMKYRSIKFLLSLFKSVGLFIRDFNDTLMERSNIQQIRTIDCDEYLRLRVPLQ
jgi:N-acetylglucosaminyl-diphospho-decaprenol L-rhamnosyltransferase